MRGIVIAAGLGERMKGAFPNVPKSMVPLGGIPLVGRAVSQCIKAGCETTAVVCRPEHGLAIEYLRSNFSSSRVQVVVEPTLGGARSLFVAAEHLRLDDEFLLCTVDNVFSTPDLEKFVRATSISPDVDAILWTTRSDSSDTSQVGVVLDTNGRVKLLGKHLLDTEFIAEGPMRCSHRVLSEKAYALREGILRLSDFLSHLVARGYGIWSWPVEVVFDVDNCSDLERANAFVARLEETGCGRID